MIVAATILRRAPKPQPVPEEAIELNEPVHAD
jgi:hypothetical protein